MRYLIGEIERFIVEERKMALVAGPRQVGKTLLARHILRQARSETYFNWDIESHRKSILRSPEGFWRAEEASADHKPRLALDEIHKYPRWKRFLKGLYDASGQEAQIVVTGSGRLDIYQKGGDSLFGRYGLYHLHPFTVGEMLRPQRDSVRSPDAVLQALLHDPTPPGAAEAFRNLEEFTGFPEPLFSQNPSRLRRWRSSHRHLIVREDLRDLTRIRDIGLIDALVELLPERIGSPLSLNNLREDLGVAFGTAQGWLAALERLYFLFEIRPYAGRLARALRREGKVYLYDCSGVPDRAARFENLVALHLLKLCDAWNDFGYGEFKLHYVRDKEKREADFLVTQENKPYLLVETKLSESQAAPALLYFQERLKPAWTVQVIRDLPADHLRRERGGLLLAAAPRFLACLP